MGITDEEREAIIEFDRLRLRELESFASEQIRRLEFDEGNKFVIDGRFTRAVTPTGDWVVCGQFIPANCDNIAVWTGKAFSEFDGATPQPVNLTPGALGVRGEE